MDKMLARASRRYRCFSVPKQRKTVRDQTGRSREWFQLLRGDVFDEGDQKGQQLGNDNALVGLFDIGQLQKLCIRQ